MRNLFPGASGDSGRYAVPASVTNVINDKGEAMRKFLMAAALLAVAACGKKNANAADTTTMAPAAAPAMAPVDTTAHDTGMKMTDTTKKDTGMMKKDTTKPAAQ